MTDCGQCKAIERWEAGDTGGMVLARTLTGYVTLLPTQYYPGHTVFVSRRCVAELHELGDARTTHLDEMGRVAEAVCRTFNPRKLNTAALGNQSPHLHWSIIPRYEGDPQPAKSPWEDAEFWAALYSGARDDRDVEIKRFEDLFSQLRATGITIEREWPASV
jgi:diadenosine tetraphosphate (Ap4A) HIT family hydrolase